MQICRIAIEETTVREFELRAENARQALAFAGEACRRGNIVLEPGEVQYRQMALVSPEIAEPQWRPF